MKQLIVATSLFLAALGPAFAADSTAPVTPPAKPAVTAPAKPDKTKPADTKPTEKPAPAKPDTKTK